MQRHSIRISLSIVAALLLGRAPRSLAQAPADTIMIRIVDSDLGSAVQLLGRYLDRPVLLNGPSAAPVTLETPRPISRGDVLRLLRGLLEANGLELLDDSTAGLYRARPRPAAVPTQQQPTGRPARGGQPDMELFVLPLKHARASDVAATLTALFGGTARSGDGGGAGSVTLGDQLRQNLVPPAGARVSIEPPRARGTAAALSGDMTVIPDERANSLLLRVNRSDFELIERLVEQIDVRPLQVLIEVLIAEVRRDRSVGMNVESSVGETPIAGSNVTLAGAIGAAGLGDFALRVMGIGGIDADATLTLASQNGEVRILSRPVVLAANNQLAEIIVGSQRPFVQVQRSLPTDAASRDQIVQYKEVGTKLTVTPSISIDGSVHLEVTQEVSNATTETAFNAPVISTRSVRTQLLVRDGQTIALGGLTDRQDDRNRRGFPVLSNLPWIGGLFGSSQRRSTETELFVFLTPRVIRTDDDAMRLTNPIRSRVEERRP